MKILSELSRPYNFNSISDPIGISHYWVFSGHMLDFKLEPLSYVEQIVGPVIRIKVRDTEINIPASWHIVAVDTETYTLDTIPITACATFDHDIFLFSPNDSKLTTTKIKVIDYFENETSVQPVVPKGSILASPVGEANMHGKPVFYAIMCGPHDIHRHLAGTTVGDVLG